MYILLVHDYFYYYGYCLLFSCHHKRFIASKKTKQLTLFQRSEQN